MRLSEKEKTCIVEVIKDLFGESSIIRLFGSRVDDALRGGDIDLLIETNQPQNQWQELKLKAMSRIQLSLGDQKLDIIVKDKQSKPERLVEKEAIKHGVIL